MLDQFYYENNEGTILTFGKNGLFANYNDLRDYEWGYNTTDDVITGFHRGVTTKTLPVIFVGRYGQECRENRNHAFEVIEADVIAKKKGRLHIGDWYMNCWIYGISNSDYLVSERLVMSSLKVVTDDPVWRREKEITYLKAPESVQGGLDFPFNFPFDFQETIFLKDTLDSSDGMENEFVLIFHGPAAQPSIKIADHTYRMNCTLLENERVEIDSVSKTILKYAADGVTTTNFISKRYKTESIFEKIAAGENKLVWNGAFDFTVKLMGLRSEPVWTWTEGVPLENIADIAVVDDSFYLLDYDGNYILDSDGDAIIVGM